MGRTQVFDWFRRFKERRTSVESDTSSGRPSTSRNEEMIDKVRRVFRNNRRLTVREIADDCGISVGSCDAMRCENSFSCIFISILYMIRTAMCPSSGEWIVSVRHLVYFNLCRRPSGMHVWVELHEIPSKPAYWKVIYTDWNTPDVVLIRLILLMMDTWLSEICKCKAVPLQAWNDPEGSRKLRFPYFMRTAQDCRKVVSLTHRPLLPPGNAPGTHFC